MEAVTEVQEAKLIAISTTFESIDRRNSSWVLDGTEDNPRPTVLNAPADQMLKTTSVIKVMKPGVAGYSLRQIRYIKGCDTIFVDEQEAMKVRPNPGVDRADLVLKNGSITVLRSGATIGLHDYLKNYEGNGDNPLRPDSAVITIMELKTKQIAETNTATFDDETNARLYLMQLKKSETDKAVTYKEKEIDFLVQLFRFPYVESYAEKFEQLITLVKADPVLFNSTVANAKSTTIAEIRLALKLGAVKFDADRAMLPASTKVLLTGMNGRKEEDKIEELAVYFLTGKGDLAYKQFNIDYTAAKQHATAVEK